MSPIPSPFPGLVPTLDAWEREEGVPWPLGASWLPLHDAYNFALFSRYATGVTLLLYRRGDPAVPVHTLTLDPRRNKTGRVWHCIVPTADMGEAECYAYRVEGPFDPDEGHRFDPAKILLDPFAAAVFFPPGYDREAAREPGPNDGKAVLGVLPAPGPEFDWEDDVRPRRTHDAIVYELHVRGFTARANSGVAPERRGTFLGLIDKIPYLVELGVTVVELMPVHQYDPQEGNYWGYMPLNFFAPHSGYAAVDPFDEFREMVKAFHAAGLEVWIDVVYNHTSEGSEIGPTTGPRGIDNRSYYLVHGAHYVNDSGTGNTLRCGGAAVRTLVLASLAHWARELRIDGFRFDLASILARRADGTVDLDDPPIIHQISGLASEHDLRLVAEAWDISSYLLGRSFPGQTWRQWNGRFRDDVRAFVKSDPGLLPALMRRMYGSDDLFPDSTSEGYRPFQSINFVTAHDGFCLYDLVSYNHKHNEANGHGNADGADDNRSWNCGWEGESGVPAEVMALRKRQVRNFCALMMLANGTPMFVAGDEFLNTQQGNNNPYNQDNPITWLDWDRLETHRDTFRFFRLMIAFRKQHPSIARSTFWRDDVHWYGTGREVDLSPEARTLAWFLRGLDGDGELYVMVNAHWETRVFTIQEGGSSTWGRAVDTSLASPDDIGEPGGEPIVPGRTYEVGPRSVVVLVGKR